jgi:hypothetical protein
MWTARPAFRCIVRTVEIAGPLACLSDSLSDSVSYRVLLINCETAGA